MLRRQPGPWPWEEAGRPVAAQPGWREEGRGGLQGLGVKAQSTAYF